MDADRRTLINLAVFIFVALTCGFLGVWVNTFVPNQESLMDSIGAGIWIAIPLITVLLLRTFAGDGWSDSGLKPGFSKNLKWYGFAALVFPVVISIALFIGKTMNWVDTARFNLAAYMPVFWSVIGFEWIKNIFEESVWRGYLTAKLDRITRNEWLIYVIVGLVWGLWHLPYYLVFLDEHYLAMFFPYGRYAVALYAVLVICVWTIMFTELFLLTRSLWVVVILHSVEDALNPLISEQFVTVQADKTLIVSPTFGVIPLTLYLLTGLYLRKQRLRIRPSEKNFG